jgi:MFS family permease
MHLDAATVLGYLIGVTVCGIVTALIGERKGWSLGTAFLFGFLLGLIGLLIVAFARYGNLTTAEVEQRRRWNEWQAWKAAQRSQGTEGPEK